MRPWCALVVLTACGRLGFDPLDQVALRARIEAAPGLSIVDADARIEFRSLDPNELHTIASVPGTETYPLGTETGALRFIVTGRDAAAHVFTGTATAVVTGSGADVEVVLGDKFPASCFDGQRNGDESSPDCGGSCAACAVAETCTQNADCITQNCLLGACEVVSATWSSAGSLPDVRMAHAVALGADGVLYAYGGSPVDGTAHSEVYAYDPVANSWSLASTMQQGHARFAGTSQGGTLYAFGGLDAAGMGQNTVERVTPPSTTWSSVPPMPNTRSYHAAVAHPAGLIWLIGGASALTTMTSFDGTSYVNHQAVPVATRNAAAVTLADGRILSLGGHDNGSAVFNDQVYAYDIAQDTWSALPSLPSPRSDLAAVLAPDGRVYALAGFLMSSGALDFVDAYRPGGPGWVRVANLSIPRDACAGAVGLDGRIYVVGGRDGVPATATVEAYGPRISITGAPAAPDSYVAIDGAGFAPLADIRIEIDGVAVAQTTTKNDGTFSIALHAPSTVGTYVVRALDSLQQYPVTTKITVE